LVQAAFQYEEISDHKEHYLVERLRKSKTFIPELSLVAEIDGLIVGHILLTKIKINNGSNNFGSLALAPVSELPCFQNKGIGSQLIKKIHNIAQEQGHSSFVLLGHSNYYPCFRYERAEYFDIELPFDVPK
jgi:predicted N-acetyltransferase YhbS